MSAVTINPPGGGEPILMSQIETTDRKRRTFMPLLFIQYPHRKTPEMMIAVKGHDIRCLKCGHDISKTKRV